jgi:anti-sigma factor RsiW
MSCPGDLLSGLVDGELEHGARERVLSHLLVCATCQHEVQVLRALKTRLSWAGAETPTPSDELTARLLHMTVPGVEPTDRVRPGTVRPVSLRPAGRGAASSRPTHRLRRRAVGGLVALGLSAAFVLGGQSSAPAGNGVPIDPTTDQFVADYVDATLEVPLHAPLEANVAGISK